jgi:glyoxylase-like metal-dependent hydrolase (beta-lactamase superfamily II)
LPGAEKGGPGGQGAAKGGAAAAPAELSEDLGGGFWLVTGGYGSVIANFKDYVMLIEGPSNDMRMDQIIAEAKRLVPNKPIRYVVNTHFHFDHTGGLRAAVANGITIITHQNNKGLYEDVMANSHALIPDELQMKSPRPKAKVEYVGDKKVYTDGEHTVEIYHVEGSSHNNGMLMIYLPKQKILINADEFNVGGQAPTAPVAMPNSYQVNFLKEVERRKLEVDRHIPIHLPNGNRKVTQQELRYMAGVQ